IVEAYLIYWALVYLIARRVFRLTREWAAPLASGISICGVSAAIATAAAIRARPVVAIMVSSLVVLFAVVELVVLPFAAEAFLVHQPLVAGAWMGLAVKTDGAAVASGAITEALLRARAGTNVFRVLFFVMTFFTIGLVSNFAKLREEGIGRLALVYVVCLFGFIVWIGLAVSWIFFHGMEPPRVG